MGGDVVLNWVFEENMHDKEDVKWRNSVCVWGGGVYVWTDPSGPR
jgi:hypothetical protein